MEELSAQLKKAEECETEYKAQLSDSEVSRRKLESELNVNKKKCSELSESRNKNLLELSRKRSRRGMLMDMEREFEGYAKGVKGVMTAYNDGKFKNANIFGPRPTHKDGQTVYNSDRNRPRCGGTEYCY